MTGTDASHPYREWLIAQITARSDELAARTADFLFEGFELPFDEYIVQAAGDRVHIDHAIELTERDGYPNLAELLREYRKTLVPRRPNR